MQTVNTIDTNPKTDIVAHDSRIEDPVLDDRVTARPKTAAGPSSEPEAAAAGGEWPKAADDASDPFDREQGEKSLELVMDKLCAIFVSDVRRTNVAPPNLVSVGFCFDRLFKEDRQQLAEAFRPSVFNVDDYDDMFHRAMAYWYLTIRSRQAADMRDPLEVLLIEANPLRSKLLRAAEYLWADDPRLGDIVANIRSGHAYLNKADDMGNLTQLFIDNWDEAENRCDVTKEDVVKTQELGARFLAEVATVRSDDVSELKELKLRAGEYLRRGIAEIRTAATFLFARDEERLSRYPQLYKRKRRASDQAYEESAEPADFKEETAGAISEAAPPSEEIVPTSIAD